MTIVNPVGFYIEPKELKKRPNVVIWGRKIRKDGVLCPWVKFWEVKIDEKIFETNKSLFETYITLEK